MRSSTDDTETPGTEVDPEVRALRLEAEKAKLRQAIAASEKATAESSSSPFAALIPNIPDTPTGQITLGDNAGAFGPYLAHECMNKIAQEIAQRAADQLKSNGTETSRVLVIGDRTLLEGDWAARGVRKLINRHADRVNKMRTNLETHKTELQSSIDSMAINCVDTPPAEEDPWRSGSSLDSGSSSSEPSPSSSIPTTGSWATIVNLLGLLRTDHTLTATPVSPAPAEILTLTAASLSSHGIDTEADYLTMTSSSRTAESFELLLTSRDGAVNELNQLQVKAAPILAEIADLSGRHAMLAKEWTTALADSKPTDINTEIRTIQEQLRKLHTIADPTVTFVEHCKLILADVDAAVATLTQPPSEAVEAPLFKAVRWERVDKYANSAKISHVLYVNVDALAADVVTRRSLIGTSGRLRFLAACNTSWLLISTETSTVVAGGQASMDRERLVSLEPKVLRKKQSVSPEATQVDPTRDPLARLELSARIFVVAMTLAFFSFGLTSIVAVIRLAFGS